MILTMAGLSGCAAVSEVRLPPLAPDAAGDVYSGKFVWIDLVSEDVVAAASFYSRLFGWRAARSDENADYYLFYLDGKPIAGMVAMESEDASAPESLWLLTMSVDDVDSTAALVDAHGGEVLEEPLDAEGRGRMALISDPAGAPLVLLHAAADGAPNRATPPGGWLWTDLFTTDAGRAGAFYRAVAGYRTEQVEVGEDHRYDIFRSDKHVPAGLVQLDWEGLEDNWLPYFRVENIDRTIETARRLGGLLILRKDDVAVLCDSTGAAFGIQRRPK